MFVIGKVQEMGMRNERKTHDISKRKPYHRLGCHRHKLYSQPDTLDNEVSKRVLVS